MRTNHSPALHSSSSSSNARYIVKVRNWVVGVMQTLALWSVVRKRVGALRVGALEHSQRAIQDSSGAASQVVLAVNVSRVVSMAKMW